MGTIRVNKTDGSTVEIQYKPTPRSAQAQVVSRFFVNKGWRPAEAAMHVATMSRARLRDLYQKLIILGEVKQ